MNNRLIGQWDTPNTSRRDAQEDLILEATSAIYEAMTKLRVSKSQLADTLGKTRGYISQVLSGERNMTLRTLADFAWALNRSVSIRLEAPEIGYTYADTLVSFMERGFLAGPPTVHRVLDDEDDPTRQLAA